MISARKLAAGLLYGVLFTVYLGAALVIGIGARLRRPS